MHEPRSMGHSLWSVVVALAMASPAAALAADAGGRPALSEFDGIDANRDGRISAAEHADAAGKMFRAMDTNRDGNVTADEMDAVSTADKVIRMVDRDGDGVITASEHHAASKEVFLEMDANRDGYLSREELAAGRAALMKRAER